MLVDWLISEIRVPFHLLFPIRQFSHSQIQNNLSIEFQIIRRLEIITITPTPINIFLIGSLPANLAAIGAAITPPIINPRIVCQWLTPKIIKKVSALAMVTKNSVKLTEPMTYFGVRPLEMSVLVTSGPQPPPPKESRNPPAPASHPARFTFCAFRFSLNAFVKILIPRIIVYTEMIGRII